LKRTGRLSRVRRWTTGVNSEVWREGLPAGVDGHHAIPGRLLRALGLHDYLSDTRNRVPLTRRRHERHESRVEPLTREELPDSVWEFADELGLRWYLEKHYPSREAVAA
jgi:hypothetical protein